MNSILKFFKFDWLNSEERKELEQLRKEKESFNKEVIREETKKEILREVNNLIDEVKSEKQAKPYKSRRLIGDTLYVILHDGTNLQGEKDLFDAVGEAKNEQEILELFIIKEIPVENHEEVFAETEEERQQIKDNLRVFRDNADFEIKNEEVYMTGISLSLPAVVAASFIEILEKMEGIQGQLNSFGGDTTSVESMEKLSEQYQALKMFWLKLAVNPLENSRNQLLTFVKRNDVRITATGNLVLYRRIVKTGNSNKELVDFISQQYTKIKAWKKSPKNYFVVNEIEQYEEETEVDHGGYEDSPYDDYDDDYDDNDTVWVSKMVAVKVPKERRALKLKKAEEPFKGDTVGNLQDLYLDLPNMKENTYTSQHNSGKYTIRVGSIYKIDESELDVDATVCHGGGLHAANVNYNYGGYGETPVVVLVNPSKALTVPYSDSGKIRVTEMFIMCINDKPLGTHYDDVMIYDEEYNQHTIEELENAVATKDFSTLSIKDNKTLVNELDIAAITEKLKSRVVTI